MHLQGFNLSFYSLADSITAQIINPKDPAREFVKLLESGKIKEMLEKQNNIPATTWLGEKVDRLFGWGLYQRDVKKVLLNKRAELGEVAVRKEPWNCSDETIIYGYMNTSFKVQELPNSSCILLSSIPYYTEFFQLRFRNLTGPNDVLCRVGNCVSQILLACYPNCLPCENATYPEMNTTVNEHSDLVLYNSKVDEKFYWAHYLTVRDEGNKSNLGKINAWQKERFTKFFNSTINYCEDQELNPTNNTADNWYLTLLLIPPIVATTILAIKIIKQRKENRVETPT